jgi:RTX toxin RtxA
MKLLKLTVTAALLFLAAAAANANLIQNGSFENPNLGGGWNLFSSIPGWTAVGAYPIEIGAAGIYGVTGQDGLQVMELDSTGNAMVQQIVASAAGSYQLSFRFAQRAGVPPSSGSFNVYWNGNLIQSFAPSSSVMSLYSTTVSVLANNTLEFRGTGTQDSLGALVDNVVLDSVPDGGITATLLGAAMLAMIGHSRLTSAPRRMLSGVA